MSVRLYGDIGVRPTADTDIFVPSDQRRRCDEALRKAGWRHIEGVPPAESTYQRSTESSWESLEVHSALLDENMLAHIEFPEPESTMIAIEGHAIVAHSGLSVPIFLAAHLAKHTAVPMLWWVDFATYWGSTSNSQRDETRARARRSHCQRYLAWAEQGALLLESVAGTNPPRAAAALRALHKLHSDRPVIRLGRLAGTPVHRLRVYLAWIWPVPLRRRPLAFLGDLYTRLRKFLLRGSRHTGLAPDPSSRSADRNLEVTRADFVELVRLTVQVGGSTWVRAKGGSMLPAIPRGAAVRLTPIPARGVRRGDVVLATLPGGQPVLHRVLRTTGTQVHLKGDNVVNADLPIRNENVVALVDVVRIGETDIAIGDRPKRSLRLTLGRLRFRIRHRFQHD